MTIQGARIELINMLNDKNLPLYYEPSLKKVIETIEQEYGVLDKIRAEIKEKYEKYKYLFDTDFMGTKDLEWVLSVIDKYMKGSE